MVGSKVELGLDSRLESQLESELESELESQEESLADRVLSAGMVRLWPTGALE